MLDTTRADGAIHDNGNRWSACTLTGPGRGHNSDALAIDLSGACLSFVIADGVGAMPGSPIASDAAATAASDWITKRSDIAASEVASLMGHVDRSVKARLDDQELAGATTIVALAIGAGQGLLATVGDSEAIADSPAGLSLSAGWHRLEFRTPGYETASANVTIVADKVSTVQITARPLPR